MVALFPADSCHDTVSLACRQARGKTVPGQRVTKIRAAARKMLATQLLIA
jgi:hypothetical protein